MKEITEEQMRDSARFANFAQRVKLAYWKQLPDGYRVPEIYLDDILLLAWEDLKTWPANVTTAEIATNVSKS